MPKPKETNDRAVWWDIHLDAAAWYRTEAVTPVDAAILLSGHNPSREAALEAAQTFTNASTGPEDYRRLLNVFEGADPTRRRSLPDWIAYASARVLPIHPWVEEFHEVFVSAYVIDAGKGDSGNGPMPKKRRQRWSDPELRELENRRNQSGRSHKQLANLYGISRQRIGSLLKRARGLRAPKQADWNNPFKRLQTKK
jgi:hypothetical protein